MQNSALFRGFDALEREKTIKCLGANMRICNTNETIMSYRSSRDLIYIMLSGAAEAVAYDYNGNKYILERYSADSVFGDMFFNSVGDDLFSVVASSECRVLCFHYQSALVQCEKLCNHHTRLIRNLFSMVSEKLVAQTQHIEILTKRTTKEKLLAYFKLQQSQKGAFSFVLPMSLSALADYLSIDRSAMQRELKCLNDEKIIASKGRRITILDKNG